MAFSLDVLQICVKEHEHWYSEFIRHNTRVNSPTDCIKRDMKMYVSWCSFSGTDDVKYTWWGTAQSIVSPWTSADVWPVHAASCTQHSEISGFASGSVNLLPSVVQYLENVSGLAEFENLMNALHVKGGFGSWLTMQFSSNDGVFRPVWFYGS